MMIPGKRIQGAVEEKTNFLWEHGMATELGIPLGDETSAAMEMLRSRVRPLSLWQMKSSIFV